MKPTIRPARESDMEAINRLVHQDTLRHIAAHPEEFRSDPDTTLSRGHFISTIEDDESEIYAIAELDGATVGFVNLILEVHAGDEFFKPRRRVTIDDLIVDPEHPEARIALLEAAEAWANHHEADYLSAIAYSFNAPSAESYQNQGFAPHTVRFNKPLQ